MARGTSIPGTLVSALVALTDAIPQTRKLRPTKHCDLHPHMTVQHAAQPHWETIWWISKPAVAQITPYSKESICGPIIRRYSVAGIYPTSWCKQRISIHPGIDFIHLTFTNASNATPQCNVRFWRLRDWSLCRSCISLLRPCVWFRQLFCNSLESALGPIHTG